MYFKENWQSMAEKEPAFGHVVIFQTSPTLRYQTPPSRLCRATPLSEGGLGHALERPALAA